MDGCRYCKRPIRVLPCRDGRSRTFEPDPRSVGDDRKTGFVLVRYRRPRLTQVLATPVGDIADRKLTTRTQAFDLHFCAEYAEQRMRIGPADMAWLNGVRASEW